MDVFHQNARAKKPQATTGSVSKQSHLEFLKWAHDNQYPLSQEDRDLLKKFGYIDFVTEDPIIFTDDGAFSLIKDDQYRSALATWADSHLVIVDDHLAGGVHSSYTQDVLIVSSEKYIKGSQEAGLLFDPLIEIEKSDWMPKSLTDHDLEFVSWIDSINSGFRKMKPYKPFLLYMEQARRWLAEDEHVYDFSTIHEKKEFAQRELTRMSQNTMYAMDKYVKIKDGDQVNGEMKYQSKLPHRVMLFLLDCGYSFMLGKARQIAATTTLGAAFMLRMILRNNYFIKFITEDKETGEEIFEDKVKYAFAELPDWMKPVEVPNDRDNLFKVLFNKGAKKGSRKSNTSKLQVVAPTPTAINGGSPPLVGVDECGFIKVLDKMLKEARPTMFVFNPATGKQEMKRQICIWGTGGATDKGGGAYEREWHRLRALWNVGDYSAGIITIFFDWTTRPGMTQEMYENEKRAYAGGDIGSQNDMSYEERMIQFRQHYPTYEEDMFMTSHKTLIPVTKIHEHLERCTDLKPEMRPRYGFFEPIVDTNAPAPEGMGVDFRPIGARFVPCDPNDDRCSTEMFIAPQKWRDRYIMGVDPIAADNGHSKMAATVMDAYYMSPVCLVNFRNNSPHDAFMQVMLCGLYYYQDYGEKKMINTLLESNVGQSFREYLNVFGYRRSLIYRTQLPQVFQGGSHVEGMDMKGARKRNGVYKLKEFFSTYGRQVYLSTYFVQLKHFICKLTPNGTEVWGTEDATKFNDDALDSLMLAYIGVDAMKHKVPEKIDSQSDRSIIKYPLVLDQDGKMVRKKQVIRV